MDTVNFLLIAIGYFFVHYQSAAEAVCMNGEMRAVGANITQDSLSGDTLVSARVQLCLLDQWADICDTDVGNKQRWHSVDGDVACKQLRNDNSTIDTSAPADPSRYTIGVTGCFGIETRLVECSLLIETDCGSRNALVTNCIVTASKQCTNGDIDIQEGEPMKICEDGRWKYLCGQLWSDVQAEVACRQAMMSTAGARGTKVLSPGGSETLKVHHTCSGRESKLSDCLKSTFFADVNCAVVAQVNCQGLNDSTTENINITSLSPTAARVSWIVQSDDNSDSFTIICISSGHNTVSVSGSLQSTLSDGRHTTTINGLDPDTLYRCCVTLRDEDVGSTQLCSDVKQPTTTLNDGAIGSFDRNTTRQSCADDPVTVTSSSQFCSATTSTVTLATPVTTTVTKTTSQVIIRTIVVAPPQSSIKLSKSAYQVQSTSRVDPSSGAQAGITEPLSWGLGIVIGVVGGVGTMTAILFLVLLIVLLKLRKSAPKQLNANSLMEIHNSTYTSDTLSEKQSDVYEYVSTPSTKRIVNVYDSVPRESVSSFSDVDDQKGLVPDEYVIMHPTIH